MIHFITPSLALISLGLTALFWRECWRAATLRDERDMWKRIAAHEQQRVGELAPDALRWRLHLADCKRGGKTAAERQRAPILAMRQRLEAEIKG